jgi:hypothetical protein
MAYVACTIEMTVDEMIVVEYSNTYIPPIGFHPIDHKSRDARLKITGYESLVDTIPDDIKDSRVWYNIASGKTSATNFSKNDPDIKRIILLKVPLLTNVDSDAIQVTFSCSIPWFKVASPIPMFKATMTDDDFPSLVTLTSRGITRNGTTYARKLNVLQFTRLNKEHQIFLLCDMAMYLKQ